MRRYAGVHPLPPVAIIWSLVRNARRQHPLSVALLQLISIEGRVVANSCSWAPDGVARIHRARMNVGVRRCRSRVCQACSEPRGAARAHHRPGGKTSRTIWTRTAAACRSCGSLSWVARWTLGRRRRLRPGHQAAAAAAPGHRAHPHGQGRRGGTGGGPTCRPRARVVHTYHGHLLRLFPAGQDEGAVIAVERGFARSSAALVTSRRPGA